MSSSLIDLPEELILMILKKCDIKGIHNIYKINEYFKNIIDNTDYLSKKMKMPYFEPFNIRIEAHTNFAFNYPMPCGRADIKLSNRTINSSHVEIKNELKSKINLKKSDIKFKHNINKNTRNGYNYRK